MMQDNGRQFCAGLLTFSAQLSAGMVKIVPVSSDDDMTEVSYSDQLRLMS
jgi:hypothetical protein